MKLIVLMSVEESSDVLEKLLVNHKVPVFSGLNVEGYKMTAREFENESWFSDKGMGVYSHVYFSFLDEKHADSVLSAIEDYNEHQEDSPNPLRGFQLDVERSI
ncbi:MAG: hypothetical protein ACQETE_13365 [Bacteroidota bacterium]